MIITLVVRAVTVTVVALVVATTVTTIIIATTTTTTMEEEDNPTIIKAAVVVTMEGMITLGTMEEATTTQTPLTALGMDKFQPVQVTTNHV